MKKNIQISMFEIIGSKLCVASSDGQKVFDRLTPILKEGHSVTLSFNNITTLTSAFLNAAIGQLYGVFTSEQLRSLLSVIDLQADDKALLKRVVQTAKLYFKDPTRFEKATQESLGDNRDE